MQQLEHQLRSMQTSSLLHVSVNVANAFQRKNRRPVAQENGIRIWIVRVVAVHTRRQPVSGMKIAAIEHAPAIEEKNGVSIAPVGEQDAQVLQFSIAKNATAPLAH